MNILKLPTAAEVNEVGADLITSLVQTKPNAVLGLATGSTPVGIYQELIRAYQRGLVSFKQVKAFNLDEYVGLPATHSQSYAYFMKEQLFNHIDIDPEQTNIPSGTAADPHEEGKRYDALLESVGNIDLQIHGIGHNGHIGFNEPAPALVSGTHVVELAEQTREANARFFDDKSQVPTHALTMGVGSILKAKTILLVAKGADKANIVHRALTGPITTECPASLLQTHPNLVVLLDSEAGRNF